MPPALKTPTTSNTTPAPYNLRQRPPPTPAPAAQKSKGRGRKSVKPAATASKPRPKKVQIDWETDTILGSDSEYDDDDDDDDTMTVDSELNAWVDPEEVNAMNVDNAPDTLDKRWGREPSAPLLARIQSYPLVRYLRFSHLPSINIPANLLFNPQPWPVFHAPVDAPGVLLRTSEVMDADDFDDAVAEYAHCLREIELTRAMSLNHIRLPQNDLLQFEPRDHRFFETAFNQTAQADTMFVQVMQEYVLCTISECIRVIERMPPRSQLAESVMFKAVPRQKLPANAPWDALILPSEESPISILVIPPWRLSNAQLACLSQAREFPPDFKNQDQPTMSDSLWGMIHDACFMRSRYFVVTNYLTWTFGYFAPNQTTAYISETYHPIMMLDANDRFDPAPDESKRNVAEYLLYWVQRARGAAR